MILVMPPLPKEQAKTPEFGVRSETIRAFFSPPLARSTFHDLVNKGKIIPMKGLRGFYLLNESLRRLGLREVNEVPGGDRRSAEDLLRLGFSLIDQSLFPVPAWVGCVDSIDLRDGDHARALADRYFESVNFLPSAVEKLAYFQGVLDCEYAARMA